MTRNGFTYRHILKYTGIFGSIQAITVLASILRNKAAALLIDRYGQGLSELFNNTINLLSTATTLVIPVSTVRQLSRKFELYGDKSEEICQDIKVVRSWSVLTGLFGSVLVALISPILSQVTYGNDHFVRSYFFLSPMLLMLSVNGTEIAILKATRRLKQLASASIIGSVTTLLISASAYYFLGVRGVIVSLVASLGVVTLLNLFYTLKAYPYKASPFNWAVLAKGGEIIRLSISLILASTMAALSEMLIRTYISHSGSIENVGLYGAGFALTVTYTKFIFMAMDADYYPHLSAIADYREQMNTAINRQVLVCVLLIVPCLILFALFLPQIIKILYRQEYLEVVPMVMCSTFFMFSKAINTPVAYTSLAQGDARMFLLVETIAALLLGSMVIGGYQLWGLMGCGIGLALSNFIEIAIILCIFYKKYGVALLPQTWTIIAAELSLLILGLGCIVLIQNPWLRYPLTIGLIGTSGLISYRIFTKSKQ